MSKNGMEVDTGVTGGNNGQCDPPGDEASTGPPTEPPPGPPTGSGDKADGIHSELADGMKNQRGVRAGWRVRENKQIELLTRMQERAAQVMAQKDWARRRSRGRRGRGGKFNGNQGAA